MHSFPQRLWSLTTFLCLVISRTVGAPTPTTCHPKWICCTHECSPSWFLTRSLFNEPIKNRALFYTYNAGPKAKQLSCGPDSFYISIWQVWPAYMYEPDAEELKWIYQDPQRTDKYYHSMSKAFAMMARGAATSLHEPQDYLNPPLTGIFGKTEVPTLGNYTDIAALWKIKNDPLRTNDQNIAAADVYYGPYYHAPRYANLVQQNMWETEQLLKNKPPQEHDTTGNNGVAAGSSCYLMTDEKHPLNAAAGGRGV